jgi:cytochrome c-type biogenesis protein CcmE
MTRKQRRMGVIGMGMAMLGISAALVLTAFEDGIVFFYSPTDLIEKKAPTDQRLRIGGLVEQGSVKKHSDGVTTLFTVTDTANTVQVAFRGILPDLFREGQGIVAEGMYQKAGTFRADEVLAKHDENYMPPEVADALKKAGTWKDDGKK